MRNILHHLSFYTLFVIHLICPTHHLSFRKRNIICPTLHLSYTLLVLYIICFIERGTHHLSYTSFFLHIVCPTHHLSYTSFFLHIICPTHHFFYNSYVLKLICSITHLSCTSCPPVKGTHHLSYSYVLKFNLNQRKHICGKLTQQKI